MTKGSTKITKVITGKSGAISKLNTNKGNSLTPKQAAKIIDKGAKVTHKGTPVQSVGGKYVRTKPDGKTGNNLVQG